jgi:hypothetical protein
MGCGQLSRPADLFDLRARDTKRQEPVDTLLQRRVHDIDLGPVVTGGLRSIQDLQPDQERLYRGAHVRRGKRREPLVLPDVAAGRD